MKKHHTGFSLIELLFTIAIAGILMAIAIPNFRTATRNNCMTTSVNLLVVSMQYARSEAIKRRQNVSVAAGDPAAVPAVNAGNEWGGGWYVWTDLNGNGAYTPGEVKYDEDKKVGEELLRITVPNCAPLMQEAGNDDVFTYRPNGFVDAGGTVDVCMDNTGERGRRLRIGATGRPRVDSSLVCGTPSP